MLNVSVIIPTLPSRKKECAQLIRSLPPVKEVIVVNDENLSLSQKRNKGAFQAKSEYLLFIDDDNTLKKGSLEEAIEVAKYSRVGVVGFVGCYAYNHDKVCDGGSKRNKVLGFTTDDYVNRSYLEMVYANPKGVYEVDEVANAFLIKRSIFKKVRGFDHCNFPIELDEADLCYRLKNLGYRIVKSVGSVVYHKSYTYSRTPDFRSDVNAYFMGRNKVIFNKKHGLSLMFFPVMVALYVISMYLRCKPNMAFHFCKGVYDGLRCSVDRSI